MSFIQKLFSSRVNGVSSADFVGQEGRVWWDPITNSFYSGNGVAGGTPIGGGSGVGTSGYSGYSGTNGIIGVNGLSGYSGVNGAAGTSGYSGTNGTIGTSGYSGTNGAAGTAGTSGYSGTNGIIGIDGLSGYSGVSGATGTSGYSGISGVSGVSASPSSGSFTTAVSFSTVGPIYMPQQSVSSVLTFTLGAGTVQGSSTYVRLVADGVNAPVFTGYTQWGGSMGYDNRNGIVNQITFWYDGYDYWYSIGQALGATPIVSVIPTVSSITVQNSTPSSVDILFSVAIDTGFIPSLSAFTVSGKTLSGVPVISGNTVTLTVISAFTSGQSATAAYTQPGTNNLRSTTAGLVANFSGVSVTNNVASVASAVTMTGPTTGTVSVASTNFTLGVSPNGGAIAGTVIVTPNDSAAGGTFTPTSVNLTTGSPTGTFTYTPASTGAKTIAVTNNGGLTNPANITYTAGAATTVPDAPTIGTATAGVTSATVAFTAPVSNGGATITGYTATSSPGGFTGTLAQAGSGTITVNGLTAGTPYTFTVTATNSVGTGSASAASNSVTPTSASFPRFITLSNMTESGTGPYTYQSTNSGGFGTSGGILNQSFQTGVDGTVDITNVARVEFIFGLQTGTASVGAFGTYPVALHTATVGAPYAAFTSGVGQTELTTTTNQINDIMRLRRVGTTVFGEVARAATPTTWISIYTWTGVSTSAIHPVVNVSGSVANITNPTTSGLA
jgi:hypothetical protein